MQNVNQMLTSRIISSGFNRSVYADILKWGESEVLSTLCHTYGSASDLTYIACLKRFYARMKRYYRCEYVFKNEIIDSLRKHYAKETTYVANEFRVGDSIVDLAFFNGESCAYEIKTSYDSPRRLMKQLTSYKRVFDKCYLVVEEDEVDDWLHYDEEVGVIAFCHGPKGRIWLHKVHDATCNNTKDPIAMMDCLRAYEYESIATTYAGVKLSSEIHRHYEECKRAFLAMEFSLLDAVFLKTLEQRECTIKLLNEKGVPRELYQMCLCMHLSRKQLGQLLSVLNQKIM